MKSMTLGVFAYVLAFASTRAAIFDFSVTTGDGGELLPGLILAGGGLLVLARRRQKIA
jgi:hypothetical protein